jgi:hypothetical protein
LVPLAAAAVATCGPQGAFHARTSSCKGTAAATASVGASGGPGKVLRGEGSAGTSKGCNTAAARATTTRRRAAVPAAERALLLRPRRRAVVLAGRSGAEKVQRRKKAEGDGADAAAQAPGSAAGSGPGAAAGGGR